MKMIIAVVKDGDASELAENLSLQGFGSTKLSSTGSFLRVGNTTFMIGVEDEKLQEAFEIIKTVCKERVETLSDVGARRFGVSAEIKARFGGAVVFVMPIESYGFF